MENSARTTPKYRVDRITGEKPDVKPKRKGLRQSKILSITAKSILVIVALIICASKAQAQQYKFKKWDNYHLMPDYGYTVNEPVSFGGNDSLIVNVTNDSIKFSTPVVSISEQTAFKIEKREDGVDEHGNKYIGIKIVDKESKTVINLMIDGNSLSTSFEK